MEKQPPAVIARQRIGETKMQTQLSLTLPPAARRADPITARLAGAATGRRLNELHDAVLASLAEHGPLTDEQLERLPRFACYGPSTIRKRRSELYQLGLIRTAGEEVNSRGKLMIVWARAQ